MVAVKGESYKASVRGTPGDGHQPIGIDIAMIRI